MPGPLEGLRVVDCSWGAAGPRATGMLADDGADVIWVEPPAGDPWRRALPAAASVFNRGKRSRVLDLTRPDGRDAVCELVAAADVFVESWRPGIADRLGVGYAVLHERNPALVYCSISGFGVDGPRRDVPGHEALVPRARRGRWPSSRAIATARSSRDCRSRRSAPRISP